MEAPAKQWRRAGVRDELHRRTPRGHTGRLNNKLFEWLSGDVGHPKLREHLGGVVMLMKVSPDKDQFNASVNRLLPKYPRAIETNGQRTLALERPGDSDSRAKGVVRSRAVTRRARIEEKP